MEWRPQRDSNPRYRRERASQWAKAGAQACRRIKSESAILSPEMARRPERGPGETLDRKQLAELYRNLSMLSPGHVGNFYHEAYSRCSLGCGVPPARAVQEPVTAWKLLRKWKR